MFSEIIPIIIYFVIFFTGWKIINLTLSSNLYGRVFKNLYIKNCLIVIDSFKLKVYRKLHHKKYNNHYEMITFYKKHVFYKKIKKQILNSNYKYYYEACHKSSPSHVSLNIILKEIDNMELNDYSTQTKQYYTKVYELALDELISYNDIRDTEKATKLELFKQSINL